MIYNYEITLLFVLKTIVRFE